MQGVYLIRNTVNQKVYVGQSDDIERRRKEHRNELNTGRHINKHLLNAWHRYGSEAFSFEVVEHCDDNRWEREQYWITQLGSHNPKQGYNKTFGGEKGKENFTPETIEKIRAKAAYWKNRDFSPTHRANLGKSHLGSKRSATTKALMSSKSKGRRLSPEARAKIAASKRGKSFSTAGRLKNSRIALAKLNITEAQLVDIYQRLQGGEQPKTLAQEFNVNTKLINDVDQFKRFTPILKLYFPDTKCADGNFGLNKSRTALKRLQLNEVQLLEIYHRTQAGESIKELAREFGLKANQVSNIKLRKSFTAILDLYLDSNKKERP